MATSITFTSCGVNNTSSPAEGQTLSCNQTGQNLCTDYPAGYQTQLAQISCPLTDQFSSTSNCPTTNRVGSCATTSNGFTITTRYYTPTYSSVSAQGACKAQSGTFTAG